jgi:hypothetical protein
MPVLATTDDQIVPRSILRRRPLSKNTTSQHNGKQKGRVSSVPTPITQRASRLPTKDTDEPVSEWKRPTEAEAVQPLSPIQKLLPGSKRNTTSSHKPPIRAITKVHPLFYLALGMLVMLALWLLITTAISWTTTTLDDLHYGRPRTFQTDAWVGHNQQTGQPSHFIAINLHRHIQIIEFPGGDASHARVYNGPQLYGANDDLTVVTLTFVDVNGNHQPDMIINFQNSRTVFINDKGGFRPLLPSERSQVEQFLQHMRP